MLWEFSGAKHTSINFQNILLGRISYFFSDQDDEMQQIEVAYPKPRMFLLSAKT